MTDTVPTAQRASRPTAPVLMYHSISDVSTDAFRPFTVAPDLFAAHLDHLVEHGYTPIAARDLVQGDAASEVERPVVLTFDDAYLDFYEAAFPLLHEHRMPVTLFVPTGFVGGTSRWLVEEHEESRRLLSWGQLAELSRHGVEIGSHTHSHPQLDLLDRAAVAREVALSTALLEDNVQQPVATFAYPFGYSKRAVREAVADAGYAAGFAVRDLRSVPADDAFAIPRFTVTADTTVDDLALLLSRQRTTRTELRSSARAGVSRLLRKARLKKRANSPGRAVTP